MKENGGGLERAGINSTISSVTGWLGGHAYMPTPGHTQAHTPRAAVTRGWGGQTCQMVGTGNGVSAMAST